MDILYKLYMICRDGLLPILASITILTGCSPLNFTLKPYTPKIGIIISPLENLAADYQYAQIPMDSLAAIAVGNDFIEVEEFDPNYGSIIMAYQNPFRYLPNNLRNEASYFIRGEVERFAYEPIVEVKKYIENYALYGWLGLALSKEDNKAMGAYVQYRFYVMDKKGITIDSFLIVGASSGDPKVVSRKKLTEKANYIAAYQFSAYLASRFTKEHKISVQRQQVEYYYPSERMWRYVEYMKELIGRGSKQ